MEAARQYAIRARQRAGQRVDRFRLGFVLLAGAKNPDGGTKALWPIFGIANQLLAAIALCLATTVLLKTGLRRSPRAPVLALVTLVPLLWLLTVTFTAGWQKLFHPSPRIGFLAALAAADSQRPMLETALADARSGGDSAAVARAATALATNRLMRETTGLMRASPRSS